MVPKFYLYVAILSFLFSSLLSAQPGTIPYHFEDAAIHSGIHKGSILAKKNTMEYSNKIRKDKAAWLRLMFSKTELCSDSYILITSLKDGAQQKLDSKSIKQWNNTSAFFNGNELSIELHVAAQDSDVCFNVEKIMVGEINSVEGVSTICGTEDNRTASYHSAIGRIVPGGCTGWIPAAGVLVTAGHCAGSEGQVIEFNVPASLSDGTIQHPAPSNQYTIDQGSWDGHYIKDEVGTDWAVFRVNNNSVTGLQPIQVQNAYFLLSQSLSATPLRVTGYGVDGPSPNFGGNGGAKNSDNQIQQTHSGVNSGSYGTILSYQADTQPGNSGSPIIDESTQNAIGIHTNGGCTSLGGSNYGTSTFYTSFWNAVSLNINLSSAQYIEPGSGASYKVNGTSVGTSFSGRGGIIEAEPPGGFMFINWSDGSYSNPKYLTENITTYATFKGIEKSSDVTAYSNNGQRRLIETKAGTTTWLHKVYTSGGHVWIEHSSNGGSNWIIGNNSQPLDGTTGGKNPSIAFVNNTYNNYNYIGVVWQELYNSTYYKIKGKVFNQYGGSSNVPNPDPIVTTLHTEPSDAYSVNANPNLVLAGTAFGPYFVTFERKSTNGTWQPGINWLVGQITDVGTVLDGPFGIVEEHGIVTGTNAGTLNIQVSSEPETGFEVAVNLIRQQSSPGTIFSHYLYLYKSSGGYWNYTQYDDGMISYNADVNSSPSIVTLANGYYSACWIEYYDMAFYHLGNSTKYYYGDYVQSCSINRGGGSSSSGFAVWSQNSPTWSNRSVRFDNGIPVSSSASTLSTTGRYVQAGNGAGSDLSNMYVSSFYPFTSPYYFSTSGTLGPLSKETPAIVEGRGFVINKEDATFSYRFGDLNVDGKNIGFTEAPDGLDFGKIETLNSVLVSEPFHVNKDSKIIFSESSGFADSSAAVKKLGKNGFINYKVELIDESTGIVIAPIKNMNLTSSNVYSLREPSYLLNANGLSGKTVRVKITVESNLIEKTKSQLAAGDSSNIPEALKARLSTERSNLVLTKSFKEENETLNKTSLDNLEVIDLEIPTTYALEQNFPNPFNPTTTINYQLPADGVVTLKIYDALGSEVKTLVNEVKQKGKYTVTFNASELASGVYFYRINVNDYTATKKLMLLK